MENGGRVRFSPIVNRRASKKERANDGGGSLASQSQPPRSRLSMQKDGDTKSRQYLYVRDEQVENQDKMII